MRASANSHHWQVQRTACRNVGCINYAPRPMIFNEFTFFQMFTMTSPTVQGRADLLLGFFSRTLFTEATPFFVWIFAFMPSNPRAWSAAECGSDLCPPSAYVCELNTAIDVVTLLAQCGGECRKWILLNIDGDFIQIHVSCQSLNWKRTNLVEGAMHS